MDGQIADLRTKESLPEKVVELSKILLLRLTKDG